MWFSLTEREKKPVSQKEKIDEDEGEEEDILTQLTQQLSQSTQPTQIYSPPNSPGSSFFDFLNSPTEERSSQRQRKSVSFLSPPPASPPFRPNPTTTSAQTTSIATPPTTPNPLSPTPTVPKLVQRSKSTPTGNSNNRAAMLKKRKLSQGFM